MFDEDPKDMAERILGYHPESDCYFICNSRAEFESYCSGEPCDDVTYIDHHEAEYKRRQDEDNLSMSERL